MGVGLGCGKGVSSRSVASICVQNWGDREMRPEGPNHEARRAEAGGVLEEGNS